MNNYQHDNNKPVYTCPMHHSIKRDSPGKCSECGMTLVIADNKSLESHSGHDMQMHAGHANHDPAVFKRKFWWSLLLTMPVLAFSSSVQSFLNIHISFFGSNYIPVFFGSVLFIYGGSTFLKSAKDELSVRKPGMMTLISMAIIVAFGYSLAISLGLVHGMDFWWELATLIAIMLLGHWIEISAVKNAQNSLHELAKLLPDEADLITSDGSKKMSVDNLSIGDYILLRPGAKVPADGLVTEGETEIDESMLTGESRMVMKAVGSEIIAGTINGNGSLVVKVAKTGDNTTLANIIKLVSDAQNSKSKTQVLADKAAFYLTFFAIFSAIITLLGWSLFGHKSVDFILERVVTVLVTACPHALGLAIPLVVAISTTLAVKQGLLIKKRTALETARNINTVLFDKTGTLTTGKQKVEDILSVSEYTEKEILLFIASLEQYSEHSIGKSIVEKTREQEASLINIRDFSALPGYGVKGVLTVDNKEYFAVSRRYVIDNSIAFPEKIGDEIKRFNLDGKTEVYLIKDKIILGMLTLSDEIRKESYEAISVLKSMGIRTAMLTGDSKNVASYIAGKLNIDNFYAEVQPSFKSAKIKELQTNGDRVAMVGDGVNDAPALAQADVSIAIGAGTDVAVESADIILISDDPRGVIKAIKLSKVTYRKMIQNLIWATGYNIIAIPLAAGVFANFGFVMSPAIGAIIMSLSTVIVVINAQLLRKSKI
jgi:Cu2+-exporting ATPase